MNQYELRFKVDKKYKTAKVLAKNYDDANKVGIKIEKKMKKELNKDVEFIDMKRVYKKKQTEKSKIDWGEQIAHNISYIPFLFDV